jgi:hypothetical protein
MKMRKAFIIALGLVAISALVGVQPADARKKGPPTGIGGGKPPAGPGHASNPSQVVIIPGELAPRHPQPTDRAYINK